MAKRAEHSALVAGTQRACFDALLDFESYPGWQRAVKSVEVLARDDAGRGRDVAFEIDAKVRAVRYTLRYSYDDPRLLTWDYLEGDVKDVDGEFELDDAGDGSTRATYRLRLDPGVWLPGPVLKILSDQVMKGAVEDLRRYVEAG